MISVYTTKIPFYKLKSCFVSSFTNFTIYFDTLYHKIPKVYNQITLTGCFIVCIMELKP